VEGRKPAHLRRCYLLVQPTDDTESNPITLASRTCSHWSGKTSSPLPDHQTSLLVQPGCTFQTRVSVCVTRQSCFALRSLVVHPGCTNATAPACNLYWPSVGPGTHRIVKCRFSRSRLVQPVCINARYGPGRAITPCKRSQGNRAFCRCHRFALSSPTIQQASRAGQESFCHLSRSPYRAEGRFIPYATRWPRFFRCSLAASNFLFAGPSNPVPSYPSYV